MLFFDLPVEKSSQRKDYRRFIKVLKTEGFLMLQKSVYIKLSINLGNVEQTKKHLSQSLPKEGSISLLVITERQFSSIEYLLGDFSTDVVNSEERIIEL